MPAIAYGYSEWQAPAALRGAVACLWAQSGPDGKPRDILVLPDGCTDLIWEEGRGAYLAGPDTGPAPHTMPGGAAIVGVRFRPGAGGPVLGVPLSELRDQRVDLAELLPGAALELSGAIPPELAVARTLGIAGALVVAADLDPAVAEAASLLGDPRACAQDAAAVTGVSPRQLRRRFHSAVGYGPKTLQRVLRFRRFVSRIDVRDPSDLATLAVDAGYADQAHLTRECVEFSGLTPLALMRERASD